MQEQTQQSAEGRQPDQGASALTWEDVADQPLLDTVDVVIIGAGPAGSAAAIHCATHGLSVAVVERQEFPRHRPGETLHPGIEPLMAQLGVEVAFLEAGFLRHSGNWSAWGGAPSFQEFGKDVNGPWLGFQAPRMIFDNILSLHAKKVGCTFYQPCRATDPIMNDGCVEGILTDRGVLRAGFVVDAAGSVHWLSRKCQDEIITFTPQLIAWYGYCRGSCPIRDKAPLISSDANGWTWTAKIEADLYQWTKLDWQSPQTPPSNVPEELRGLKAMDAPRGEDVTWRRVANPATPGCFRVGDAAGILDPSAAHGVLKALMSGIYAGNAIVRIHSQEIDQIDGINGYNEWFQSFIEHDMNRLKEHFEALPQAPEWMRNASIESEHER